MTTSVDDDLDKAFELVQQFRATLEAYRTDATLTDLGRRPKIAAAYLNAKQRRDKIVAKVEKTRSDAAAELHTRAYGPKLPTLAGTVEKEAVRASFRGALLTAQGAASETELAEMMTVAERSGDRHFARATAIVAVDRGLIDIANRYAAIDDEWDEAINEVLAGESHQLRRQFRESAMTTIDCPAELAGLDNSALVALAGFQPTTGI